VTCKTERREYTAFNIISLHISLLIGSIINSFTAFFVTNRCEIVAHLNPTAQSASSTFQQLKQELSTTPVLQLPDFDKSFIIE
jgi:hypothetical protein